jgi:glycosyltransferase involved in cell wall biosynthesis
VTRQEPRVSVVIPYWNAEEFLLETLESVRRQSFERWELILVDDGSTDGSARIAADFASSDRERIRCVAQPGNANRGQSAARNLGLGLARGDLIAFLDADDVWLEQKLEVQVGIVDAHPEVDVTFGPYHFWHSWSGNPAAKDKVAALGSGSDYDRPLDPPYLVWRHVAHGNGLPVPSSVLMRTAVARRIGGFEANAFPGMYDDESFFAKVLVQSRAWVHRMSLDRYRQHPRSFCARAIAAGTWNPGRNADVPDRRRFLLWLADLCRAAPIDPQSRERLVAAVEKRISELVTVD